MPPDPLGFLTPPFDEPGPSDTDGTFTGARGAIEYLFGGSATAATVTLPSWSVPAGDLILVYVYMHTTSIVATVAGMGLTFTGALNGDKTADRAGAGGRLQVFQAVAPAGAPSVGPITVTATGNTISIEVIAARYSGLSLTTPVEAATVIGTGGADTTAVSNNVTSLTDGALIVTFIASRNRTVSGITAGSVNDVLNHNPGVVTGGNEAIGTLVHRLAGAAGNYVTAATASGTVDWIEWTAALKSATAPASAAALAGQIDAVSAVPTAVLTTSITMNGTISGVSASAGTLTTSITMVGQIDAVSNLPTAALTTSITMGGTVTAVSGLTGALTTSITMVGSSAGQSAAAGTLTTSITMVGSSAAVTGTTGTLTFPAAALAGTVTAVAALTGAMTTVIRLTGTVGAAASLTGDLTGGSVAVVVPPAVVPDAGGRGPLTRAAYPDWTLADDDEAVLLLALLA